MPQHPELQRCQPCAGFDAELVGEPLTCGAEHSERLGLPVGAIVGERDDRPAVFAQRLLAQQALGVGDPRPVLTGGEPRVEPLLFGARPDLVQTQGLCDAGTQSATSCSGAPRHSARALP